MGFGDDCLPDVVALDHLTSGCLIDDERDAYLYRLTARHLAAAALDPTATQALLRNLAAQPTQPRRLKQHHHDQQPRH